MAVKPYKWSVAVLTFIIAVVCSALMYLWHAASAVTATPATAADTPVTETNAAAPAVVNNGAQAEQQQYSAVNNDDAMDDGGVYDIIDGMLQETQQVLNGGYDEWLADHPNETDTDATDLNTTA
jgi:hypothetical protein